MGIYAYRKHIPQCDSFCSLRAGVSLDVEVRASAMLLGDDDFEARAARVIDPTAVDATGEVEGEALLV